METKYFLMVNGEQKGPLTIVELIPAGLTPDTYVWHEGLTEWKMAKYLPELMELISNPKAIEPEPIPDEPASEQNAESVQPQAEQALEEQPQQPQQPQQPYGPQGYPQHPYAPYGYPQQPYPPQGYPLHPYGPQGYPPYPYAPYGYPPQPYPQNPYPNEINQPEYEQPEPIPHKSWVGAAITFMILGFIFGIFGGSFLGGFLGSLIALFGGILGGILSIIFGIIAIVKASRANYYYNKGNAELGDKYNSRAKTFTIMVIIFTIIGMALFSLPWIIIWTW